MTKVEMFNAIKAVSEVSANADMVAFIDHEIELLSKRSGKKSETKTQKENKGIKQAILEVLATLDAPVTVSELIKSDNAFADLSNQKVSALLRQLISDGKVIKTTEKKVSRFALA